MASFQAFAQQAFLDSLLQTHQEEFPSILSQPEKYRLQILFSRVHRKAGKIQLETHGFRDGLEEYFYPASTVKLAASVLALEKINELDLPGLSMHSPMQHLKDRPSQTAVMRDSSSESTWPSIAHYIKKILLVSDNDAYNRLYEFLGQKEINEAMARHGFEGVRLAHRLQIPLPKLENQWTNPVQFLDAQGNILYQEGPKFNPNYPSAPESIPLGIGVMNAEGKVDSIPMECQNRNAFPLKAQHEFLQRLMLPQHFPRAKQFHLKQEDYSFLWKYLSENPKLSQYPNYAADTSIYASYCKFLYDGADPKAEAHPNLKIFNKIGNAYGFLIDNAYFLDEKAGVEFFLTATVLVNEDGIFNDDRYQYDLGFSFLKALGRWIYDSETVRLKPHALLNVSVGNLRAAPKESAELVSQVLMGSPLKVLSKARDKAWYLVQAPDGYQGWVEGNALQRFDPLAFRQHLSKGSPYVCIKAQSYLYQKPIKGAEVHSDLSYLNWVQVLRKFKDFYEVLLPDARLAYAPVQDLQSRKEWELNSKKVPGNQVLMQSAKAMLGIPYLWGGTSVKGFDCSGYTKTIFQSLGLDLPRDASMQAKEGRLVDEQKAWDQLQAGDLLFFGERKANGETRVVHVGIWEGNGKFLHAGEKTKRASMWPKDPDFDAYNEARYLFSRRIIKPEGKVKNYPDFSWHDSKPESQK